MPGLEMDLDEGVPSTGNGTADVIVDPVDAEIT
jgi:hypothetical protein